MIYLVGSLRNPNIRTFAKELREHGFDVFEDWHAAGPDADDIWRKYEEERGRDYFTAIKGHHARCVFDFDMQHINRADIGIMMMPAGISGHQELAYMVGKGKRTYVLFDGIDPPRWDIMTLMHTGIFRNKQDLINELLRQQTNGTRLAA